MTYITNVGDNNAIFTWLSRNSHNNVIVFKVRISSCLLLFICAYYVIGFGVLPCDHRTPFLASFIGLASFRDTKDHRNLDSIFDDMCLWSKVYIQYIYNITNTN